jgi:tripartite-type tricarboxylate transporter receptor subunit TctC
MNLMKTYLAQLLIQCVLTLAAVCIALAPQTSTAQAWPNRSINVLVPGAPSTPIDVVARTVMPFISAELGQPAVIKNNSGSGGIIGLTELARAPKDGHTVGFISVPLAILPSLYKLPYDADRDIVSLSVLASGTYVLVVNAKLPVSNVKELLALARSRSSGKELTYGSAGIGTLSHLAFELFKSETGTAFLHIPFRATDAMTVALISGEIDAAFISLSAAEPLVRSGRLKIAGIASQRRAASLPEVATLPEQGVKEGDFDVWVALIVPSGLPQPVIDRLSAVVSKVLRDPHLHANLQKSGYELRGTSFEETQSLVARDRKRFADVISLRGIPKAE